MNKIISLIKSFKSYESSLFIYSLSFSLLLTIAPALIVIFFSIQYFQIDATYIIEALFQFIPKEFIEPFIEYIFTKNNHYLLSSISIFFSLYLSSRCIYSFLLISYNSENISYPLWSLRLYSIFEFVLIYIYLLFYLYINTFIIKYTLLITIFYFSACLFGFYTFYHLCTFKVREKEYGLIGALFVTMSIYLIGQLFYKILFKFTNYENIYGPLSNFMVLLLLVYIISNIIYIGYLLNNHFTKHININRKNTFFKICDKINEKITERKNCQ